MELKAPRRLTLALICFLAASCSSTGKGFQPFTVVQAPEQIQAKEISEPGGTLVVMLGTGTPNPDPERSGPAVAVIAGGRPYIVDCGAGVVRRAAAAQIAGIDALSMPNLSRLFMTHLHSDHTLGFADLILTPWILEREDPLVVYGPAGVESMTEHILAAYKEDIDLRIHGSQPQNATGIEVLVHEIEPGTIYRDDNVTVTAFAVQHGSWDQAFGFRFDSKDRSIVISGDTIATEAVVNACDGCDVLVHEVYAKWGLDRRTEDWQAYYRETHTSGVELGELAARARPKLLVLYHQLMAGATREQLLSEIRQHFDGEVKFAADLDIY